MVRSNSSNWRSIGVNASLIVLFILFGQVSYVKAQSDHNYVVFEEDFEDKELENWEFWSPESSTGSSYAIFYDNGNNVLRIKGDAIGIIGNQDWENYTVETRVKFVEGIEEAHINFRMNQPSPRYFIRVPEEKLVLTKEYKGEFIDLTSVDFSREDNIWYTLRFTCEGNQFWVYLDNDLQFTFTDEDEPLTVGRIGLESSPSSVIFYDDVRIYASHEYYVHKLIEEANNAINDAIQVNADTSDAEETLEDARKKEREGDYKGAENLANKAINQAIQAKIEKLSQSEPTSEEGSESRWSIEMIAAVISICAACFGVIGWGIRTKNTRRRGQVLFTKLLNEIDDVYTNFKMNANRCETELLKIKGEVLAGFKEGILEEESLHDLEGRIDAYLKEVRKEIKTG